MSKHDPKTTAWQRVPLTLTARMRDAFWRHMTRNVEDGVSSAADECWSAMLQAAREDREDLKARVDAIRNGVQKMPTETLESRPPHPLVMDEETKLFRYATHADICRWEHMELRYNNLLATLKEFVNGN